MTPLPLEQQLKRLPVLEPKWKPSLGMTLQDLDEVKPGDSFALTYWDHQKGLCFGLEIKNGKLQGWEALGFMLTEMQGRSAELDAIADGWNRSRGRNLTKAERVEREKIRSALSVSLGQVTPELILSTYVAWKEVTQCE